MTADPRWDFEAAFKTPIGEIHDVLVREFSDQCPAGVSYLDWLERELCIARSRPRRCDECGALEATEEAR